MSNPRSLENMKFKFTDDYIGSAKFKNATFDAFSLATLTYNRDDDLLNQIRNGMKIIEPKTGHTIEMDDDTFSALIAYGNDINAEKTNSVTFNPNTSSFFSSFSQLDGSQQDGNNLTPSQQSIANRMTGFKS